MRKNIANFIPDFLKPAAYEMKFWALDRKAQQKELEGVESLQKKWKKILENSHELISNKLKKQGKQHILFFTGYGHGSHYLTIEPILISSLFMRGCRISGIYCSKALPACEFNAVGNNIPSSEAWLKKGITNRAIQSICEHCTNKLVSTYNDFPIDMHPYDEFMSDDDYRIATEAISNVEFKNFRKFIYEGIEVGEEAFASILRVTFMGTIDDSPKNRKLVKRYLLSGVLLARLTERAFREVNPNKIMLIHGIYLTHGIPVKVAHKLGIPIVVIGGGGIRRDTALLCHHETYHRNLVTEPNTLWENNVLSDEQKKIVIEYAEKKRTAGSGVDYLNYHPNPIEDTEHIYQSLALDRSKPIISAFTNVIWDAQIFYGTVAFEDIFDWIFTSIEVFGKNNNVNFVIRIHPAEVKGVAPTRQPMLAEIERRFPTLPSNVRVIAPESDISSYTLANLSKVAIIYGTKMGLEMSLMKIPLIICGSTFNRGKGYGLDISSKDDYIKIISEIHKYRKQTDQEYERALRYAHYLYFRRMIKLPFTSNIPGIGKTIDLTSFSDLEYGKDIGIDRLTDGILSSLDFCLDGSV